MKPCLGRCGRVLPLDKFHKAKLGTFGRASRCKECKAIERIEKRAKRTPEQIEIELTKQREANKRLYHNRPPTRASQKDKFLRTAYGISLEQYEEMERSQGFVCAVCQEPCVSGRRLSVDHNHETGEVRGLLCMKCNRGIGNLGDSAEILRKAVDYLDKFESGK